MANNAFGIDLGTNNIKIYNRNDDNIMIEKNMIAIENKNTLFAYGNSAFEMYEKAPGNIHISYPLSNGVIADIKNMETLVKYFIGDLQKGNTKPSDFFIAVPTDVTEVEKRAFYDLIKGANVKAKKIMVVEKAVADGLGLDIDVKNSQGVLVVNVGYETTEISILSLGGIVLSRLIKVGGMKFDDAIRAAVRREFSLIIGGKTAENVKIALKELEEEGIVPYCPKCQQYRFPMYNVAVSMIVVDEETGKILLIQQYGKPSYILVAGYVNRGEAEEHAVVREVREETGLEVEHLRFNRTYIRSAQGIISRMKIDYCQTTFIGMARFLLWAVKNPDRDFRQSGFPVP